MPLSRLSLAVLVLALSCHIAAADDDEPAGETEAAHHPDHHANHVAVFIGGTTGLGEGGTTHLTLGADYERRLPFADHRLGLGLLVDAAIGDSVETLAAPFVAVHPLPPLMLLAAVGVAVTGAGHDGQLALRGAAAYFFPVGKLSLGPAVSVDRVAGETAVVYGASIGAGF